VQKCAQTIKPIVIGQLEIWAVLQKTPIRRLGSHVADVVKTSENLLSALPEL
jgi:hypothetical protein